MSAPPTTATPPAAPTTPSILSNATAPGEKSTETKPPETPPAPPETKPEEKPEPPKPGVVPEKYELKSSIEGITFDEALLAEFAPLAKELKLDNAQAQKIADLGAKILDGAQKASLAAHVERVNAWAKAAETDKEIGGDKLAENLGIAKGAVLRFGGDELLTALRETGFENHPALLRAFLKVGRAMKDDNFAANLGEGGGEKPDLSRQLYNADGSPKR